MRELVALPEDPCWAAPSCVKTVLQDTMSSGRVNTVAYVHTDIHIY